MNRRLIFFLIIAIVLALIVVISQVLFLSPRNTPSILNDIPIFQQSPKPTPNQQVSNFKILSISPPENTSVKQLPIRQIEITFSEPINQDNFIYTISPEVKTYIIAKPETNTLILHADPAWQDGITTLVISDKTSSSKNKLLDKSYTYKINTEIPITHPPGTGSY